MPGIYAADRNAIPGRAGLALPYTPTTGPILIGVDTATFLNKPMMQPWQGDANEIAGIRTEHMSDCIVVCVAELKNTGWGSMYFHHIMGGYWLVEQDRAFQRFRDAVDNLNNCYSVVMATYESGTSVVIDQLKQRHFQPAKMSLYLTYSNSADVAVARENGSFGEVQAQGARPRNGQYGYRGPC
jgi:hypothetical protein